MRTGLINPLDLIIDQSVESPLKRNLAKKRLHKLHKTGRLDPYVNPEWAFRVCAANLYLGDYNWKGYECRSEWAWTLANHKWHYPRWNGESCKLLVLAEQGLGDEILFASCFEELLRDCPDTTIECDERLIPVFERSFKAKFVPRVQGQTLEEKRGDFDAFIPMGSLPQLYRKEKSDFPHKAYLIPDPEKVKGYEYLRGYTGVSWKARGGDVNQIIQFGGINLQWNDKHESLVEIDQPTYDHTIALVSVLSEVISVPATICHVAGAIKTDLTVIKPPPKYDGEHNRLRWEWGTTDWYDVTVYQNIEEFNAYNRRISRPKFTAA